METLRFNSSLQEFKHIVKKLELSSKITNCKEVIKEHDINFRFTFKDVDFNLSIDTRFLGFQMIKLIDFDFNEYSYKDLLKII